MKFRRLRMAWSVFWGLIGLLFVGMWVRSYWRYDLAIHHVPRADSLEFGSVEGAIYHIHYSPTNNGKPYFYGWMGKSPGTGWSFHQTKASDAGRSGQTFVKRLFRPVVWSEPNYVLPYWALVIVAGAFAGAAWLSWRFSLRMLLLVTTLVSVMLGLVVWAVRSN